MRRRAEAGIGDDDRGPSPRISGSRPRVRDRRPGRATRVIDVCDAGDRLSPAGDRRAASGRAPAPSPCRWWAAACAHRQPRERRAMRRPPAPGRFSTTTVCPVCSVIARRVREYPSGPGRGRFDDGQRRGPAGSELPARRQGQRRRHGPASPGADGRSPRGRRERRPRDGSAPDARTQEGRMKGMARATACGDPLDPGRIRRADRTRRAAPTGATRPFGLGHSAPIVRERPVELTRLAQMRRAAMASRVISCTLPWCQWKTSSAASVVERRAVPRPHGHPGGAAR
jgi:hypothetical protein